MITKNQLRNVHIGHVEDDYRGLVACGEAESMDFGGGEEITQKVKRSLGVGNKSRYQTCYYSN